MTLSYCFFYTLTIACLLCFQHRPAEAQCKTLFVDQKGRGNYSKIQSAINSIPSNNLYWFCITVSAGTYREKVNIPYDKPYIILKGAGKRKTMVVWNEPYLVSPTFSSSADNIVVQSISFVNSYNSPSSKNPRVPAVAAMLSGDKCVFHKCGFSSVQDTLWDAAGRHYFKDCVIEGAVDFIFGNAQSLYEGSSIRFLGELLEPGIAGFITAQGRENPNDPNGFVFKNCNVYGKGTTYLGRPWRGFSRVLFYNCQFSNIIHPSGWDSWNFVGKEQLITYAEHGNNGPGSDTSKRVKWEKKLDDGTVSKFTSMSYINSDGWLQTMPTKYF
ncbi:hypothetical protein ES332_D09G235900v1 [Gossypium tomentosum]|uniref:Pectinesterase n=1 Tax=Gossypium tomentosum TaxID=34277 RepID=A0A5D2JKX6_GOSTO|nr:hypothetical protein ES332_D09G235900v1 [Gossypium tomentosum]